MARRRFRTVLALFAVSACASPPPSRPAVAPRPPASASTPDCSSLAPAGSCLGRTLARRVCETFGPKVEPAVATAFVRCASEPGDPCESGRVARCGLSAIRTARPVAESAAECEAIAAECEDVAPELTVATCESVAGSFRADARAALLDCLRTACESGAFGACLP